MRAPIATVEEFFSHAVAIEREAAERYAEFAVHFADRGEEVLAGLCHNLSTLEAQHLRVLLEASAHLKLPPAPPAGHRWLESGAADDAVREVFYRIASPRQLLEVALQAEHHAHDFFRWVRATSTDAAVRKAAAEMAAEEAEHIRWVRNALEYHPAVPPAPARAPS